MKEVATLRENPHLTLLISEVSSRMPVYKGSVSNTVCNFNPWHLETDTLVTRSRRGMSQCPCVGSAVFRE